MNDRANLEVGAGVSLERERYLQALEAQRVGWERLQAANREALRPVVEAVSSRTVDLTFRMSPADPPWEQADVCRARIAAPDQRPHDPSPDLCWRCDALPGDAHLGLCEPCRESLT